jgi:hypothetical protein
MPSFVRRTDAPHGSRPAIANGRNGKSCETIGTSEHRWRFIVDGNESAATNNNPVHSTTTRRRGGRTRRSTSATSSGRFQPGRHPDTRNCRGVPPSALSPVDIACFVLCALPAILARLCVCPFVAPCVPPFGVPLPSSSSRLRPPKKAKDGHRTKRFGTARLDRPLGVGGKLAKGSTGFELGPTETQPREAKDRGRRRRKRKMGAGKQEG